MSLRCIYCGRRLKSATAWTLGKPIGPTCAKRNGQRNGQRIRRGPKRAKAAAVKVEPGQMALELEA